jgi:hypothetical protein
MAEGLEVFTVDEPLVLVLKDLHWSDASSIDLLARIAHRRARPAWKRRAPPTRNSSRPQSPR